MKHVDALSWNIAFINEIPLEQELELRQLTRIQEIANSLEHSDNEKFALIDGLVIRRFMYKRNDGDLKFVVPDVMIPALLRIYHDNMAHVGRVKTFEGLAQSYWFPLMRKKNS